MSAAQLKAELTDLLRLLEAEDLSPETRQDATDRIMRMMPEGGAELAIESAVAQNFPIMAGPLTGAGFFIACGE
ncbi:hypothetical protein [Aeromonas jandaei]|uniref:hypothetical protein n=1 Tax=Aeromonas jandaei TaxID=650 RepID=UPI001115F260|nr:hypothetical protein [Aeromonas jandaei]TNI07422.1 hypothetical protein CF104_03920 [Aeromonas jandaei]